MKEKNRWSCDPRDQDISKEPVSILYAHEETDQEGYEDGKFGGGDVDIERASEIALLALEDQAAVRAVMFDLKQALIDAALTAIRASE